MVEWFINSEFLLLQLMIVLKGCIFVNCVRGKPASFLFIYFWEVNNYQKSFSADEEEENTSISLAHLSIHSLQITHTLINSYDVQKINAALYM